MILGYPLIAAPETLKEWKVAIILVGQGYKSTEGRHNYKTEIETVYGRQEIPWILVKPKITMTKMEDLNALITTSMGTWLKNTKRKKRETQGSVLNVNKLVILPKIARQNSQ